MSEMESSNQRLSVDRSDDRKYPACLSVVVPVYNEAATLAEVVRKLLNVPCLLEIVIVDDCSTDGTAEALARYAPVLAESRGIAWVEVDLAVLRGEREPELTLFGA